MNDKVSTTKLYIMQTNVGLVKIGVSKVVESRLETLQMVSPFQVECAAVVYVLGSSRGVYNIEKSLHHKFKDYNKVFPERFDGSTEYFTVSVSDVLEALKEFPEVAYADRRERIVYHESFNLHNKGDIPPLCCVTNKEDPLGLLPVTTIKECAIRLDVSVVEAGKVLRSEGYAQYTKILGRNTPTTKQRVWSKLGRADTIDYLKSVLFSEEIPDVITAKDFSIKVGVSLPEAGKMLIDNEYIRYEKILGRSTPPSLRYVYSKLDRDSTKKYLMDTK